MLFQETTWFLEPPSTRFIATANQLHL